MSSSSQPTQTTQQNLSPEQQQVLNLAMPGINSFAASVPQRYQGETVAQFTTPQQAGQAQALNAAGTQDSLAQTGANASNFLMSNLWDPANNAGLNNTIDAAVRPITENYQQVVQPGIRDEMQAAGQQFGGSRRGVAEVNSGNSYLRNVGDTAATVAQNEYGANLDAYTKALGLLPQTQAAQTAGAVTTSGVGDVQQNQAQQNINADVAGYNYDQLAPFLQSQELVSLLSGIPGGGVTSVGSTAQPNTATSVLGGAAAGASLGSLLGPVGGAGGAGLGALLALLK